MSSQSQQDSERAHAVQLRNPNLDNFKVDHLYHLALSTDAHNLKEMFGDVKFVCMGGTPSRMQRFANFVKAGLNIQLPVGADLYDICHASNRYAMYKVGPVISVSHGMGTPSLSILMHEIFKLLHYAQCRDVVLLRIGASGGIGIPPGSVVISTSAMNGMLQEKMDLFILGERVSRPCVLDVELVREIMDIGSRVLPALNLVRGKTLCADDFYEGQGRLDGAICSFTEAEKRKFLEKIRGMGVVNIEMEACQFAAMCHRAGLKGAIVCVTLLDRLESDEVDADESKMMEWRDRPQEVVLQFIRHRLGLPPSANKYSVRH
ncbi:uridine phosphorylase 1-like [Amblyomma americanum]